MMIAVQHEHLKTLQFNAMVMTVLQICSFAVLQFCTSARHSKSQKNNFSSRDSESCEQAGNAENDLYQMYLIRQTHLNEHILICLKHETTSSCFWSK